MKFASASVAPVLQGTSVHFVVQIVSTSEAWTLGELRFGAEDELTLRWLGF